jgi:oligopeptide transport system substrate-binding protein
VDEETQARIAELEAALVEAQAMGSDGDERIAELQSELEELNTNLGALEKDLSEAQLSECSYNTYRMGWVMDWADAGNMVDTVFGPSSPFQYTFWQHNYPDLAREFQALAISAYHDIDQVRRAETWQEAEKIVVEEIAAVIPIFHYDGTALISTDLNYQFPPFGAAKIMDWSFKSGQTTLRTTIGGPVTTLDHQLATDVTSFFMIAQMIDNPYNFRIDGSIEPLAAESFEVSEDGKVYTIHLRENALWSDGVPVIAQHYVDGIKRLLSPDLPNAYAYVMFDITGALEYNSGEADDLESVVAVDDYTLQITLDKPASYFDSILAFLTTAPVRLDLIALHGEEWKRPGNIVSNGAYVLVEHNPGENLVFEKNELYWNAEAVQIERIEVSVLKEEITRLAAFEMGELDYTSGMPSAELPRLVTRPEFIRIPNPGTYYIGLNTSAQHTNDASFRKALASAINKRLILDNVAEMPWRIEAYGVIPPEIYGYQGDAVGYHYDPEAALGYLDEYLTKSGIEDPGSIVIELWYNKSAGNQEIQEAVEAMWEEVLGIDVRTVNVEFGTYLTILGECYEIGGGGF